MQLGLHVQTVLLFVQRVAVLVALSPGPAGRAPGLALRGQRESRRVLAAGALEASGGLMLTVQC